MSRRTTPLLVQVGPAKWVHPKREAAEMAILRLLGTELPYNAEGKIIEGPAGWAGIEKDALMIAGHLGMLRHAGGQEAKTDRGFLRYESLDHWSFVAETIQAMFRGRERRPPEEFVNAFGSLDIVLSYNSRGVSMHLLPRNMHAALIYRAAQMLAVGTKLQNCEYCHTPFLSGGEARGGGKRRRDARFCSDDCRWKHHNEMRSKASRKAKL